MDRFSRLGIDGTRQLTRTLLKGGVEIHLADSGRVIHNLDDLATAVMDVVESYRDKAYTDNLRANIAKAKELKKDQAANGGWILSRKTPYWIRVVGRENIGNKIVKCGNFELIPERVAVVKEVFRLASLGVGSHNIVKQLNSSLDMKGPLTWVTRVLRDRSVLGEFQPSVREPITGYFPQVINQSEFDAVSRVLYSKRRNGTYVGGNRRNSDKADNLFSGLLYETALLCDENNLHEVEQPMHFQKVQRYTYLILSFHPYFPQNLMLYYLLYLTCFTS